MGTIIGRHYTPQDENGNRDIIHVETQIDAVLDPVTGIPLRKQLEGIKEQLVPVDVEANKPGFITPELVKKLSDMASSTFVLDSVKPTFASGGYWLNIYDPSMSTTDTE